MDHGIARRWPTACQTCARAKVRCEPEATGACKRCRRLSKRCVVQTPGAHRRSKTSGQAHMEVTRLEQKLDRMVAILGVSSQSSGKQTLDGDSHTRQPLANVSDERTQSTDEPLIAISLEEGQTALEMFAKTMTPLFPFIAIPRHVAASSFQQQRPFLYSCIAVVACQRASRQQELSQLITSQLVQRITTNEEDSLDVLQGLLVYIAWNFVHMSSSARMVTFLHLALAQVSNLGLDKGARQVLHYLKELDIDKQPTLPTLEERRAYLGAYHLGSMLSACARNIESLRYTKFTEECCQVLEDAMEYATDRDLVERVRMSQLADRIQRSIPGEVLEPGPSAPLGLYVQWQQPELQRLKEKVLADTPQSPIRLFHYYTLELLLYRMALVDEHRSSQYRDHPLTQPELLYRCLQSSQAFLENFFQLPADLFGTLPFTFWCQFGHAVVILSHLSLHEPSQADWNREYVRHSIDYNHTIDRLSAKLDAARAMLEQRNGGTGPELPMVFRKIPTRIQMLKETHRRRQDALAQSRAVVRSDPVDYDLFQMPWDDMLLFTQIPDDLAEML
ncbi:hypothetical protein BDV25DRAFT_148960 [Aspergillus avenaceus]|uniref:Zn(2)-C6 fungal-type domain-containing protein n=1 Tax=Aspergillus avenaceus TaxID=36643 RepID=A0A5N6U543_ASPAV|nr:hypothetical protein BDV25DRAFT_148960 [Aspergillus avenaceus]